MQICTFLNSAQLASWAKFKNVQNLHKSTLCKRKKKPLPDTSTDDQTLILKIDHCASDGDNGSSSRKRAVFSALISETV